jgi:hypothetical protein
VEIVKREKSGGRKAGTPNKLNFELRSLISAALATEFERLPEILAALEPVDRIDAMLKLSKFCLPVIKPITSAVQLDQDHNTSRAAGNIKNKADKHDAFDF